MELLICGFKGYVVGNWFSAIKRPKLKSEEINKNFDIEKILNYTVILQELIRKPFII